MVSEIICVYFIGLLCSWLVYKQCNGPPTQTVWWIRCNRVSSTSGGWRNLTKKPSNINRCPIESILSGSITASYGNCTARNRKALQRVVRSAKHITGGKLPALQDTYSTWCHKMAKNIIMDMNHPSYCLFTPLSSRRQGQYMCSKAGTETLKNSFYLKAIMMTVKPPLASATTSTLEAAVYRYRQEITGHFK